MGVVATRFASIVSNTSVDLIQVLVEVFAVFDEWIDIDGGLLCCCVGEIVHATWPLSSVTPGI